MFSITPPNRNFSSSSRSPSGKGSNSPFQKKSLSPQRKPISSHGRQKNKHTLRNYLAIFFGFLLAGGVLAIFLVYVLYLRDLPPISAIESGGISESTIIYDRDGNELYKMQNSDGKRTYVDYTDISQSIKDAIVSTEDKTFFENPGIDFRGLIRAVWNHIQNGGEGRIGGTSTISQQLIKNLLLTNEYSFKRKIREAVLSYELNNTYTKEKILELYLNTISFGNNALGVEEASKTYFGKSAKDVGILGATILASLPKGPTYYSPYAHRDRLMGYVYVYDPNEPDNHITLDSPESMQKYSTIYTHFKTILANLQFTARDGAVMVCNLEKGTTKNKRYEPNSDGCATFDQTDLLDFLNSIQLSGEITDDSGIVKTIILEYEAGRKDFVAMRMYADGKITDEQYHSVLVDGLEFPFKKYTENIRYPYFVFYVKEYLENTYGDDIDITSGLRVYTTIDPDIQDHAESILRENLVGAVSKWDVSSASLVSIDNANGQILAMVGGPDYYDEEHGGNNNMTTALRQPGSSFKPIVYSLAIARNPIGPDSPITDSKTKFGNYEPDNYDQKFLGLMTVAKALDYSRNIPAIKMFYLAGQEALIVAHAHALGLSSLKTDGDYGASLAIGTAEVRAIDMVQAYSVFANNGVKRDVTGILKIEDTNGNTLESHEVNPGKEVFSPAASYIISKILSDVNSRPASDFWRGALALAGGRISAAKTGTSNKTISDTLILPRDLWTIGFTPQITTAVWAGNVDGRETKGNADGLNVAAPIWRNFMNYVHTLPEYSEKKDFTRPDGVYNVTISKMSGKLATSSTSASQKVETIMAVKPEANDEGYRTIQIDILCGGPTSENTPQEAIRSVSVLQGKPVIDGFEEGWYTAGGDIGYLPDGTSIRLTSAPCDRPGAGGNVDLSLRPAFENATGTRRLMEVSWTGDRAIKTIRIYQGNTMLSETSFDDPQTTGMQRVTVDLDSSNSETMSVQAIDVYGFSYTDSSSSSIGNSVDTSTPSSAGPSITMIRPVEGDNSIQVYQDQFFNLRFSVSSSTIANTITIAVDGNVVQTLTSGSTFVIPINEGRDLTVGTHSLAISVIDANDNQISKSVQFRILAR